MEGDLETVPGQNREEIKPNMIKLYKIEPITTEKRNFLAVHETCYDKSAGRKMSVPFFLLLSLLIYLKHFLSF
jgi:hypothetical protein